MVRKDGLIAKHRNDNGGRCLGAETTPIPVHVPGWVDYPDNAGKVLERFDYLTLPMRHLLRMLHVEVREVAAPHPNWRGEVRRIFDSWRQWEVRVPIGLDEIEHDMTVRGLLAAVNGIDVSDWPVAMNVRPL